ncbi:MAG: hypothetical protein HY550_10760 [Elusimicrobia bacterium]|nr:hypothetical protein [Elusimicrobiota bacterium]
MRPGWKKGSALLQTLVMSVLLSMIAVSMMKWVLARYTMSGRNYRSMQAKAHTQYYGSEQFSRWNPVNYPVNFASVPTSGSYTIPSDNKVVNFSRTGINPGTGAPMTVTITEDPD